MLNVRKFIFNDFQENTYLVWDQSSECLIIDPGCETPREKEQLHSFIESNALRPVAVLLTHAHLDHIFGVHDCQQKYGIPVYMDQREKESIEGFNPTMAAYGMPDAEPFTYTAVSEGDVVNFGGSGLRALSTPGHSMGGLCWWEEKQGLLFSGDTLFAGCIGRTDNKWASWDVLKQSLKETLMALDGEVDVFPGHGPKTSIGQERLTNPFIVDEFGSEGYEM